ncbi:MAG: NADH-quinone oxidoreductase subunit NuoF [Elusimicrobiota bacterium]
MSEVSGSDNVVNSIVVGLASCGLAAGGDRVFSAFETELKNNNLNPGLLGKTGCYGMCEHEVMVEVRYAVGNSVFYKDVTPEKVKKIVIEHIINAQPVKQYLLSPELMSNILLLQKRIVLRNSGVIDPERIEDYIAAGGYEAVKKVLTSCTPVQIVQEVKSSGLRGRGGAGFSTGEKWRLAAGNIEKFKINNPSAVDTGYIVCNADEGDPGAFMDRSVLESDPHSVLEGMIIAAYAIGVNHGIIYVRAEYPLAIKRLELALTQAKDKGFLGNNVCNTGFQMNIKIKKGAGAFVCGEETALMASIEGRRGMPRLRPPYPAEKGLFGLPTVINNVETLSSISWIINHGAIEYSSIGTQGSKGTKVFALAGKVVNAGLIEVPFGVTLKDIVYRIGGGIKDGRKFKAVQIGGPSGGCLSSSLEDVLVDYESMKSTGAIVGSGGMIVLDDSDCMVDIARFFLSFTQNESCGKCTFCRIGTKRLLEILNKITEGKAVEKDLDALKALAGKISSASLCALGQTAPNPVLTTLKYFFDEYKAHVVDRKCPAKKCRALVKYSIVPDKCTGCHLCARNCPVKCISGEPKAVHVIDGKVCIKCGQCRKACRFDAVDVE